MAALQLSPWARAKLSPLAIAEFERALDDLGVHASVSGRDASAPWRVAVWRDLDRFESLFGYRTPALAIGAALEVARGWALEDRAAREAEETARAS